MARPNSAGFQADSASITLRNFRPGHGFVIDEMVLTGDRIEIVTPADARALSISIEHTRFRGMITEINLNEMLASLSLDGAPVRNLKLAIYSDRVQIKGQLIESVLSLPFVLDAKPVITRNVRLSLECSSTQIGGLGMPGPAVELIERMLLEHLSLDVSESVMPIYLDSVKCEPGRLSLTGRANISWPLPKRPAMTANSRTDNSYDSPGIPEK